MLTRTRMNHGRSSSWAVGLVAGLTSVGAAAMDPAVEEITVRATADTALRTETVRAELKEYLEALNRQLKEQLDADLKNQPPRIKLVLSETPSRG